VATGVSQACAGSLHTVFRKTDNTVWSCGYNGYGQLGDGTTTNRSTPAQFDAGVAAVAVGGYHTVTINLP
jgi:alpha-tubulin suppressor-like RCC1 family protein